MSSALRISVGVILVSLGISQDMPVHVRNIVLNGSQDVRQCTACPNRNISISVLRVST
jgi:hypothetical protein